jgi:hypothetical protein
LRCGDKPKTRVAGWFGRTTLFRDIAGTNPAMTPQKEDADRNVPPPPAAAAD